jgi:hypothetical protein
MGRSAAVTPHCVIGTVLYNLESLDEARFQQLCQAIIVANHPELQCLPVAQPDGGRDAVLRLRIKEEEGFVVYQVKFSRDPRSTNERQAVEHLIKTEAPKVKSLIDRGAVRYYFLTNVAGTAHLDVGSIDRVNELLTHEFGIDAYCWWRDDIERRLDNRPSIKWSFPDLLRGCDILQLLVEQRGVSASAPDQSQGRRTKAIRAYMGHQLQADLRLKFKQIDLAVDIMDQFVDVPVTLVYPDGKGEKSRWLEQLQSAWIQSDFPPDESLEEFFDPEDLSPQLGRLTAARMLLKTGFAGNFPKVVLEGAPGQGKSTVTQYLCQIYRMTLTSEN